MIVKTQRPIELVNKCGAIVNEHLLKQAITWATRKPVVRLKTIFLHGKYPAISIHGQKIHIHRLIARYSYRPRRIGRKYVDHINGNKFDARLSNLRLLSPTVHQSITNKGRKQTPEHVAKRIASTTKTRYGH